MSDKNFPLGEVVENWQGAKKPNFKKLAGKHVRLETIQAEHLPQLHKVFENSPVHDWYYMPMGPFKTLKEFQTWAEPHLLHGDPLFFTIFEQNTNEVLGVLSYLNIEPNTGSIEIGYIQLSPKIQRSTGATETIWLLMKHAFELGYRRLEWKCNSLNHRSCKAATRFGFKFEGIFRQATVVKGRNRDTAWYSIIDKEWTELSKIYDDWFAHADDPNTYTSLSKMIKKEAE